MMKKMFWVLLLSLGSSWYTMNHTQFGPLLKDPKNQALILKSLKNYKQSLKHTKLKFAGQEISLNLNKESFTEYVKAEPRAQRALFIFSFFMANVWLLPLIGGSRQRRLKQELFDLHPELVVNNMSESRETPYYRSTFFERILYMFYPGLLLIALSFVSAAATVILVGTLMSFALFDYRIRTRKYQSVENFNEAMAMGTGLLSIVKQIILFFAPQEKNEAFDQAYQEAIHKAQKHKTDRKAG